uniref:hypothetical protein Ycf36 n=1 Tax=Neustupella aerophytica TaxID=2962111 RepID=UPI002181F7C1|nr:hypothetical protein Ycf36 [Neustupella aerophytica]UVI61159.1 hypothetical protein Ycf36 [Neustupella aerophytica]
MNKFEDSTLCPVPREQRPFYEYLNQKKSILVGWVKLNETSYIIKFFVTLFVIFTFSFPIINLFVSFSYYPVESLIIGLVFSLIIESLVYFNYFINWSYIGKRLFEDTVFYEQSGWYDGKIWIKPTTILRHERLLYHYQLVPLINRIKKTLQLILLSIIILLCIFFLFLY